MGDTNEIAAVGESAEEYTEKSRLRSLFTARDEAATAIRQAPMIEYRIHEQQQGRGKNTPPPEAINEHVRAAVIAYVLECEPLFENTEIGQQYWRDYQLPSVSTAEPVPEPLQDENWSNVRKKEFAGVPSEMVDQENEVIQVTGIRSFVGLPSPIKVHWYDYDTLTQAPAVTTTVSVPRRLSEDVFRTTNKMLADLEIGLDAEQVTDSQASYDYSDLL